MLTNESSGMVSLLRPPDWRVVRDTDADLVIAAPDARWLAEGTFRPNVTATVFPFSGSAAQLSTSILASLLTSLTDPYLISVDYLDQAPALRRLEYAHAGTGGSIHCMSLVLLANRTACTVTASCASGQLSAYDEVLDLILTSAALKDLPDA